MLAAAIGFAPGFSATAVADEIARRSAEAVHGSIERLGGISTAAVYAVANAGGGFSVWHWKVHEKSFWLFSDIEQSPVLRSKSIASWSELYEQQIPGRWIGLSTSSIANSLQVACDPLGTLWMYWAKLDGGYALSCDFGSLATQLRGKLTTNIDSLSIELVLGFIPGDETLFDEIKLCPPGSVIEFNNDDAKIVFRRPVSYGDRYAAQPLRQKFEHLDALFSRITDTTFCPQADRLVLSLSAGYDSRYSLAYLYDRGFVPPLCTFGDPESQEVAGARLVAEKVGRKPLLFDIPSADWRQWKESIRYLGNSGMIQWPGWSESWLEFLARNGNILIIGYLGDALSGKKIDEGTLSDGLQSVIERNVDGEWIESDLLRPLARAKLRGLLEGKLEAQLADASFVFPHQRALHLDLYGRQRRWTAAQPNLISRQMRPGLFFYDPGMLDFWSNLPPEDQTKQSFYLAFARHRFPKLFQSPAARKGLGARVVNRLLGRASSHPPPVVDRRRMIEANMKHIAALAAKVEPMVDSVIDIGRFQSEIQKPLASRVVSDYQIIRAVNIFHLLELGMS